MATVIEDVTDLDPTRNDDAFRRMLNEVSTKEINVFGISSSWLFPAVMAGRAGRNQLASGYRGTLVLVTCHDVPSPEQGHA